MNPDEKIYRSEMIRYVSSLNCTSNTTGVQSTDWATTEESNVGSRLRQENSQSHAESGPEGTAETSVPGGDENSPLPPVLDSIRASFLSDISQVVNSSSPFGSLNFRRGLGSNRSSVSQRARRYGGSNSEDNMSKVNLSEATGTTLVREWATPSKKTVVGEPPGPNVNAETARSETRRKDIRLLTPMYKSETDPEDKYGDLTRRGLNIHSESSIGSQNLLGAPDYKEQTEEEKYSLRIIEPKVDSQRSTVIHSRTLPISSRRSKFDQFPSTHSRQSFNKLDPIEQPSSRSRQETFAQEYNHYTITSENQYRLETSGSDITNYRRASLPMIHSRSSASVPPRMPSERPVLPFSVRKRQQEYQENLREQQRFFSSTDALTEQLLAERSSNRPFTYRLSPYGRDVPMVPPISSRSDTWPTGYAAAMGRVTPRDIERPVEEIYDPVELSVRQRARRYMEVLETQNWSEPYITRSSSVPNMVEEANRYLYVSERANDPRMYGEVEIKRQEKPRKSSVASVPITPSVFAREDEYLQRLHTQYKYSQGLERRSHSSMQQPYNPPSASSEPYFDRSVSDTDLQRSVPPYSPFNSDSYSRRQMDRTIRTSSQQLDQRRQSSSLEGQRISDASPYQSFRKTPPIQRKILKRQSSSSLNRSFIRDDFAQDLRERIPQKDQTRPRFWHSSISEVSEESGASDSDEIPLSLGPSLPSSHQSEYIGVSVEEIKNVFLHQLEKDSMKKSAPIRVISTTNRRGSNPRLLAGDGNKLNCTPLQSSRSNQLISERYDHHTTADSSYQQRKKEAVVKQQETKGTYATGALKVVTTTEIRDQFNNLIDKFSAEDVIISEQNPQVTMTGSIRRTSDFAQEKTTREQTNVSSSHHHHSLSAPLSPPPNLPLKTVYENQPYEKPVDAKYGSTAEMISASVADMRAAFTERQRFFELEQQRQQLAATKQTVETRVEPPRPAPPAPPPKPTVYSAPIPPPPPPPPPVKISREQTEFIRKVQEDEERLAYQSQQLERQRAKNDQQELLEKERRRLEEQVRIQQQQLYEMEMKQKFETDKRREMEIRQRQETETRKQQQQQLVNESYTQETSPERTWRRTFILDEHKDVIKNRISKSADILAEEQYQIDLRRAREAFIEKPQPPPPIERLGKVWQPPPDQPYEFPRAKDPEPIVLEWVDEHKWVPQLTEPEFRVERKNFTPVSSPPPVRKEKMVQTRQPEFFPPIPPPEREMDVSIRVIQPKPKVEETVKPPSTVQKVVRKVSEPIRPLLEYNSLGNEPTDRHPSTVTVKEKPKVNVKNRISAFEPVENLPEKPFGAPAKMRRVDEHKSKVVETRQIVKSSDMIPKVVPAPVKKEVPVVKSSSASVISDTLPKSIMKPQRKEIVPDGLVRNTIGKIEETRRVQQTWNKENERRLPRALERSRTFASTSSLPTMSGPVYGTTLISPWAGRPLTAPVHYPEISESYVKQTTVKRVLGSGSHNVESVRQYSSDDSGRFRREVSKSGTYGGSGRADRFQRRAQRNIEMMDGGASDVYTSSMSRRPIVEFPRSTAGSVARSTRSTRTNTNNRTQSFSNYDTWRDMNGVVDRYDNRSADVSDLRADFRRQLVNPLPRLGQNISERDYQERHIPGGKESLSRETEGKSGTSRHGAHGVTQFAESKQSLSYKKGTEEVLAKLIKDHTWESIYRS